MQPDGRCPGRVIVNNPGPPEKKTFTETPKYRIA
jgi:hypothetical protein